MFFEVTDHGVHLDVGTVLGQSGRGCGEEVSADVDGNKTAQTAVTAHGGQEQSGLDPGSGAEFEKGLGIGHLGDLVGVAFEDGAFGAGRIVLGQLGDVLEQGSAVCVVEPLGRELFGAEGQAFGDVLTQGRVEITGGQLAIYPKHAVSPVSLEDVPEAGGCDRGRHFCQWRGWISVRPWVATTSESSGMRCHPCAWSKGSEARKTPPSGSRKVKRVSPAAVPTRICPSLVSRL